MFCVMVRGPHVSCSSLFQAGKDELDLQREIASAATFAHALKTLAWLPVMTTAPVANMQQQQHQQQWAARSWWTSDGWGARSGW